MTNSYQTYQDFLKSNMDEYNELNLKWRGMNEEEQCMFGYYWREIRRILGRGRKVLLLSYAKEYPSSYFSLLSLSELSSQDVDVPAVKPLFDSLSIVLQNSPLGILLR